jgi:hypothetical protein
MPTWPEVRRYPAERGQKPLGPARGAEQGWETVPTRPKIGAYQVKPSAEPGTMSGVLGPATHFGGRLEIGTEGRGSVGGGVLGSARPRLLRSHWLIRRSP